MSEDMVLLDGVCTHGHLARSCERCEERREIERLRAALEEAQKDLEMSRKTNKALMDDNETLREVFWTKRPKCSCSDGHDPECQWDGHHIPKTLKRGDE
jgi:hypothetical protein